MRLHEFLEMFLNSQRFIIKYDNVEICNSCEELKRILSKRILYARVECTVSAYNDIIYLVVI